MTDDERDKYAKQLVEMAASELQDGPNAFKIRQDDETYVFTFTVECESGQATISYNPHKAAMQIITECESRHAHEGEIIGSGRMVLDSIENIKELILIVDAHFREALFQLPVLAMAWRDVQMLNYYNGAGHGQTEIVDKMLAQFNARVRKNFKLSKSTVTTFSIITAIRAYFKRTGEYPSAYAVAREMAGSDNANECHRQDVNLDNWLKRNHLTFEQLMGTIKEGDEAISKVRGVRSSMTDEEIENAAWQWVRERLEKSKNEPPQTLE